MSTFGRFRFAQVAHERGQRISSTPLSPSFKTEIRFNGRFRDQIVEIEARLALSLRNPGPILIRLLHLEPQIEVVIHTL